MIRDFFIVITGSLLFAFFLHNVVPVEEPTTIISPLVKSVEEVRGIIVGYPKEELKNVVQRSLAGTRGTYAVVIKNLKTQETYMQNEKRVFEPASLYKLWVMGTVYKQAKAGTITFDQTISANVADLNRIFDIDEEFAERTEGGVSYKVQEALEKMITISDNYAALLLVSKLRLSNVSAFMQEQGLVNSKTGIPPKTTAEDIALFYDRLFRGNVVDSASSRDMIELLARQQLNDRIPKYLPKGMIIAHKTGEINGFKHDAGIIFGKDPILFVVLSESTAPLGAAERIALLSKDIFNYFENQ